MDVETVERMTGVVSGYMRVMVRNRYTRSGRRARPGRGRIVFDSGRKNLIVNTAKTYLADLVRGATGSFALGAFAIGSDATAPIVTNTTLGTEVARLGIPADGTDTATQKNTRTGNAVTLRQTFVNVTATIAEAGLFGSIGTPPGASDEGVLFNRALVGPVVLSGQDVTLESVLTFN